MLLGSAGPVVPLQLSLNPVKSGTDLCKNLLAKLPPLDRAPSPHQGPSSRRLCLSGEYGKHGGINLDVPTCCWLCSVSSLCCSRACSATRSVTRTKSSTSWSQTSEKASRLSLASFDLGSLHNVVAAFTS
jgi:hypothetical protein